VGFKSGCKRLIQNMIPSEVNPILIASMGRSGSTLLFDATRRSVAVARFGVSGAANFLLKVATDSAWDIANTTFKDGVVYKTHDFPEALPMNLTAKKLKTIYVYGLASDAAISVYSCLDRYGREWVDDHFRHLHANGAVEDLIHRDVLRIEDQLDRWTAEGGAERLIVRYSALWDNVDQISDYLGVKVSLPQRIEREGAIRVSESDVLSCKATYQELDNRILGMPDLLVYK
jgi:hypothetical protein